MADKIVMKRTDTKKCRIVPVKNRHVPDVLLHNKRITEETTMDLNKMEIRRAMSFAEVFVVDGDTETLVTDQNFYLKDDDTEGEAGGGTTEEESTPVVAKATAAPAPKKNISMKVANTTKTPVETTTTEDKKEEESK